MVVVLRDTDWVLALGPTGVGKTTIMTYYLHWYLCKFAWIESIFSTTPFFDGNIFDNGTGVGDLYPKECENPAEEYKALVKTKGDAPDWPMVKVNDPYVFFPSRPVDYKGEVYYYPKLHPKFRILKQLRDIDKIEECVFFGDELGNLLPARHYKDQRQWMIAKMGKDFRKHNVIFLATDQYNKAFDIQLRENFSNVIRPMNDFKHDTMTWEYYRCRDDPDFTNYRMHMNYLTYPDDDLERYPVVRPSVVQRFFDSAHAVPMQFNEPLTVEKIVVEAQEFSGYVEEYNPFDVRNEVSEKTGKAPIGILDRCVEDWNYQTQRYFVKEELNSILSEYLKQAGVSFVPTDKIPKKMYVCQCGKMVFANEYAMKSHAAAKKHEYKAQDVK
jgi:hypothetical protein